MQGRPPAWVADVDLNCLDGVDNPTLVRSKKAVAWARGAMRKRDLDVFARYKAKAATKTKKARPQELEKDWHARLLKDACTRLKATSLPEKVLDQFELDVRRWEFPRSMGPVLGKLGHKMSKFTGAEYKNLLNTCFSVMAEPHLTDAEYGLVHHLREVSRLLDDRIVRKNHIDEIHDYLLEYQKMYMKVYGADSLTPNNHKSTHLGDCMLDYGCVHGFWLFAFERYNGLAKATNWRNGNLLEVSMAVHEPFAAVGPAVRAQLQRWDDGRTDGCCGQVARRRRQGPSHASPRPRHASQPSPSHRPSLLPHKEGGHTEHLGRCQRYGALSW
jgi:hypothetical protein